MLDPDDVLLDVDVAELVAVRVRELLELEVLEDDVEKLGVLDELEVRLPVDEALCVPDDDGEPEPVGVKEPDDVELDVPVSDDVDELVGESDDDGELLGESLAEGDEDAEGEKLLVADDD